MLRKHNAVAAELHFQLIDLKRFGLEAPPGFEPGMEVLQTSALPLGYGAEEGRARVSCTEGLGLAHLRGYAASAGDFRLLLRRKLERETGFEPATSTLARSHSTTELFPPAS